MKAAYWQFRWAFLFFMAYLASDMMLTAVVRNVVYPFFDFDERWYWLLDFIVLAGSFTVVLFTLRHFKALSWKESFHFIGFKKPDLRQTAIGFVSLAPYTVSVWVGIQYGLITFKGISFPWFIYILLTAGLIEETLFRGFFLQLLRPGRSFFQAAALAGALWAAEHLTWFQIDTNSHPTVVLVHVVNALIVSIPAAYLFERGGNVIWGFMIIHVGSDLLSFSITEAPEKFKWFLFIKLLGLFSVAFLPWALARWLLPPPQRKKIALTQGLKKEIRFQNRESARLARYLVPAALVMIVFLLLTPTAKGWMQDREITKYEKVIAEHPNQYNGYEMLGFEYYDLGRYNEALPNFQKAIEFNPKASLSYVGWGECLSQWKDDEEAISKYQKAVEISPDSYLAYRAWGYTLVKVGKVDEALGKFQKVVELPNTEPYYRDEAKSEMERLKSWGHLKTTPTP